MTSKRSRWALPAAVMIVVAGLALWWALPRWMAALPGRMRQYVPEELAELVTTPLPTALPAPAGPAPAALDLALGPSPTATLALPDTATAPAQSAPASSPATLEPFSTAVPSPTIPPMPRYARVGDLPIIPQKFNNCGPTNLTIVLNHYGVNVDQFDVAGVVRPNYEDRNVSAGELVAYVTVQTDLSAAAYVGGDVDLLRRLVAAGYPVIIEKGLEPDEATGWMGHYLTVYGYDDVTGHLLTRDTYLGPWRGDGLASYSDTERYWEQFNNTFIVVAPAGREGELAELLGPAFADPAATWLAAADRARDAARLEPDNAFVWFNLGASLTELAKLGDVSLFEAAAAAFDQARLLGLPARMLWYQFGPYEAYLAVNRPADVLALAEATLASQGGRNVEETYWYQGLALAAVGDQPAARAAFERAAALNPTSPVGLLAQAALEEEID